MGGKGRTRGRERSREREREREGEIEKATPTDRASDDDGAIFSVEWAAKSIPTVVARHHDDCVHSGRIYLRISGSRQALIS